MTAAPIDLSSNEDDAPPLNLLRLNTDTPDVMGCFLELVDAQDLCSFACACKALGASAHEETLWQPFARALSSDWISSTNPRFAEEETWAYTLRVRREMFSNSVWKQYDDHRKGCCPYLAELGTVVSGKFIKDTTRLSTADRCQLKYGAICELVQLEAAREGAVSHRTYKAVAEEIAGMAADTKTATPEDTHMIVREIYKSCYAGFGMALGASTAGMGFGEAGTIHQVIARKGVARRVSREAMAAGRAGSRSSREHMGSPSPATPGSPVGSPVSKGAARGPLDEEMRKRLETHHSFMSLVRS